MSNHTPGTWVRKANSIKSRKFGCVVVRLPAYTDCFGDEAPEQLERWDADARLIAAAPEMYDILLDIAGYKLLDGEYPLEAEILGKMADVMAKIRGEE